MSKETRLPVVIKRFGKAYCPTCNADIHGMGQIDNCIQCGQAVKWRKGLRVETCAIDDYCGMDLAKGEDFSARMINGKWEVIKND